MATKTLVSVGYILTFWGVLPSVLAALAAWGQRVLGANPPFPGLRGAAITLAAGSGIMLAVAIVQYTRASGRLPISAFPPRKLIRSGVFGIWRHPIYLFSVLFFSGLGVAAWPVGYSLVSFPVLVLGTALYVKNEEAGLEKRFGRAYNGHRRQTSIIVPRFIHVVRFVSAAVCRVFFRFEASGRENGKIDPPFFVIAAHRNYLDPVFVSLAVDVPVHFVTTSERFRTRLSRFVFVRLLGLPKKRYTPDLRNGLDIRRRLIEGCAVGIFPEAERSWTRGMLGFKPQALKLLLRYHDIPIVPIRLEGAYESWPRWVSRPHRGNVTASVGKPVFLTGKERPADLEARLSELILPRRTVGSPWKPIAGRGIETLVYRCPECLCFDAVRSGPGREFWCTRCPATFDMLPDFSVRTTGQGAPVSLERVSRRVFVGPDGPALPQVSADGFTADRALLAMEERGRLKTVGTGRLDLSAAGLVFVSPGALVRFDLGALQAVVVEGAGILQIYGGRPAGLWQIHLSGQSVLKWQHIIAEAVRSVRGAYPTTA